MKNKLTAEQQEVFDKYFETRDQHAENHYVAKQDADLHIAFFEFEVSKDSDVALEIKVGYTSICMFKRIHQLIITIL